MLNRQRTDQPFSENSCKVAPSTLSKGKCHVLQTVNNNKIRETSAAK